MTVIFTMLDVFCLFL